MPTYLFAYHGGETPETDEAQAESMAAWNDWMEGLDEALIDGGSPVGATAVVAAAGATAEAPPNRVTGYSIVEADDMDEAIEMARTCPIVAQGGNVEVAELIEIDMDDDDDDLDDEDDVAVEDK